MPRLKTLVHYFIIYMFLFNSMTICRYQIKANTPYPNSLCAEDIINIAMEKSDTEVRSECSTSFSREIRKKRLKRSSNYNITSNTIRRYFLDLVTLQGLSIHAVSNHCHISHPIGRKHCWHKIFYCEDHKQNLQDRRENYQEERKEKRRKL